MSRNNDRIGLSSFFERLKSGEDLAWKELYKEGKFHAIHRFILNNGGRDEDAKDVYQEAIIVFYQKVLSNDFQLSSSISTYVYAVSKNIWYKRLNKTSKIVDKNIAEFEEFLAVDNYVLDEEDYAKKVRDIKKVLEEIGDPCRRLLHLFYFHKNSMEEIAIKLDYNSPKTAKQQKYKCILRLRKSLKL